MLNALRMMGSGKAVVVDVNTVLLMHFDGAQDSRIYREEISGQNLSYTGTFHSIVVDPTATFGQCFRSSANNPNLVTPTTLNLLDYTIELFFAPVETTSATFTDGNFFMYDNTTSTFKVFGNYSGASSTATTLIAGSNYHIAVCKQGNQVRFYKNGVAISNVLNLDAREASRTISISRLIYDYYSGSKTTNRAYFDELRISNIARTLGSTFPVPTAPY